ncbi:MAG: hypothetical protein SFU87_19275 [Chitinophagaceae bacterium]|nr:hypothetical protein [Chitinophagaceae bacterium]
MQSRLFGAATHKRKLLVEDNHFYRYSTQNYLYAVLITVLLSSWGDKMVISVNRQVTGVATSLLGAYDRRKRI